MITVYEETQYLWVCPNCLKTNNMFGHFKNKDSLMCQFCGVEFTNFKGEIDTPQPTDEEEET